MMLSEIIRRPNWRRRSIALAPAVEQTDAIIQIFEQFQSGSIHFRSDDAGPAGRRQSHWRLFVLSAAGLIALKAPSFTGADRSQMRYAAPRNDRAPAASGGLCLSFRQGANAVADPIVKATGPLPGEKARRTISSTGQGPARPGSFRATWGGFTPHGSKLEFEVGPCRRWGCRTGYQA
jgi:hypothetical protein